jgi:hypothetical protein
MRVKTFCAVALALGSMSPIWTDQANAANRSRRAVVPAGTTMSVRLDEKISTEHATNGDRWSGTVSQSVYSGGREAIPAGSHVTGVVTRTAHGTHNSRARLDLAVREVTVDGRSYAVAAEAPPIIAGTKRAKKIGAILGGAAAGALVGRAVSGSKRGTLIGGALGGAATYGLTRDAFRTLQLKPGTVVQFTTREEMVARRY